MPERPRAKFEIFEISSTGCFKRAIFTLGVIDVGAGYLILACCKISCIF